MTSTTPIHEAIEASDKQMLISLLNNDPNAINNRDGYGKTALILAIRNQLKHSFIALLLSKGADTSIQDHYGLTPLHYITSDDQLPTVQLLVSTYNANPNTKDIRGQSPLVHLVRNRCYKILTYLLKQTYVPIIDINEQDNNGLTILHYAALNNDHQFMNILLNRKDVNSTITDKHGNTALDYIRRNELI